MFGRHCIADPAFDLHAERERKEQRFTADRRRLRLRFGQRKQRRRDRCRRMDDGRHVRVVEVEDVSAHRVERRCVQHVRSFPAPNHASVLIRAETTVNGNCLVDHRIATARKRNRDVVNQSALCLMSRGGGYVGPFSSRHESREFTRNGVCRDYMRREGISLQASLLQSASARR
jgi:hypothetical protein